MSTSLSFTPIYGHDEFTPVCFILEVDDCRIMLDCGWDYRFRQGDIEALTDCGDIDCVLVSHPDILHLGALPYAVAKLNLDCPIYATLPVWKMGQMFVYDAYQMVTERQADFDFFDIDDVDAAFDKFVKLKYSQEVRLKGKGQGITITPFTAGNMIGGTIWRISKETEDILYAIDYNHKRERHLNGTVLETFQRPSVLITDALNVQHKHKIRKERDKLLISNILSTLRRQGNVLLPCDSAGRVLELLTILHTHWDVNNLRGTYSLVYLSNVSRHTVDFAKSMIEWMSHKVQKDFDQQRENPFAFPELHICSSRSELEMLPKPWVVLASGPMMEGDFGLDLFSACMSHNPNDLVVFTQRVPHNTVAGQLMQKPTPRVVRFRTTHREEVTGAELREWIRNKKAEKEEAALLAAQMENGDAEDDPEMDALMEEEDVTDAQGHVVRRRRVRLHERYPMFPFVERKAEWCPDFGQPIDPAQWRDTTMTEANAPPQGAQAPPGLGPAATAVQDEMELEELPYKTVERFHEKTVRCQIMYIDFEGRVNGQDIKHILSAISPRKLILVHGNKENKATLKQFLDGKNVCQSVMVPDQGQMLDITSDANIFKVVIKENLPLNFVKLNKGYEVAWLDGIVEAAGPGDSSVSGSVATLGPVPADQKRGHPTALLGDVKLLKVKERLRTASIASHFAHGTLVCANGLVTVRKISPTQISVDGALCDQYFQVKDCLLSEFQVV